MDISRFKDCIGILIVACFFIQACTKSFTPVSELPRKGELQVISLSGFDVYSKHEFFNFNTFERTDKRDLNNPLNERIGINYLIVDTVKAFPKSVFLLSSIKYYSVYRLWFFKDRDSDFSNFTDIIYENNNIVDTRHFNLIQHGQLFDNGIIEFGKDDFWEISANQIKKEIKIEKVGLSDKSVVAISDNLQFSQIYRKIEKPKWVFSKLEDKELKMVSVADTMWIKMTKHGNEIFFRKNNTDHNPRYIKYLNRGHL
ncbi:hypothetical protein D3C81_739420 [compost metagenome]|nr:hypothetical protein [Sphingobacterium multivorum]QQT32829.1 hypothetical protein I6I99_09815 [Sphingobacterium multivorum]